jgi:hypothetical protein
MVTDDLGFARGWMLTPFGNLSVAWARDAGSLTLDLGIPVGVTATVAFSNISGGVFESGADVRDREGFTVLPSIPPQPMRVMVGSGQYSFVV